MDCTNQVKSVKKLNSKIKYRVGEENNFKSKPFVSVPEPATDLFYDDFIMGNFFREAIYLRKHRLSRIMGT